ncbi:MAG: 3-methyl-2-oxobutanoate hydroxymethyltransferase [bacterium]
MKTKWTAERIRALKGNGKVVCLTAYDYTTARHLDAAGVHMALVGDSLANTMLGYTTTLPVTMEQMLDHTAAVARGTSNAMVVADMPFMSYQVSTKQALANAGRFLKEAGADGVKIEGGAFRARMISRIVENGIPVLGHVGLTPQSIRQFGGYKVQGRKLSDAERLLADALALEAVGVFAIVIECVPHAVGETITQAVQVPTIGIGAGPRCDGQVLVSHDVLGLSGLAVPRFVKRYADLGDQMETAFKAYKSDVEEGVFPSSEHGY